MQVSGVGEPGGAGEPGIANWRSWVQFGAEPVFKSLSQSRAGRQTTDRQQTDCPVSRLPGSECRIRIQDSSSPDPKSAHTPTNCRHWLVANRHKQSK